MKILFNKKLFFTFLTIAFLAIVFLVFLKINPSKEKTILIENYQEKQIENFEVNATEEYQKEAKTEEVPEKNEQESKTQPVEKSIDESVDASIDASMNASTEILIKQNLVSWGFEVPNKKRLIDTIIIHSSYDALGSKPYDTEGLIDEYKQYGVAAHYLIDRQGIIYQLVKDSNIAYHAGKSQVPDGRTSVNNFSIGIEIMNTKKDTYTKQQYSSLNNLLEKLQSNYNIKYVLGHDDIAPDRKTDPWNFDWEKIK